jgi:ATP-binding cassette subfamily B protein
VRILLRCLGYLRPYRRMVAGTYAAMVGITALALLIPQFIRWIIDRGIGGGDIALRTWSVLALLALTLVKGVLAFFEGRWSEIASQGVAYDLRNAIHLKLAALSFSYHDRAETGQLLSRAVQDVDRVRFLTGRAVLRLIEGSVLLLGTTAVLLWMNPRLALLALSTMPFLAYVAYRFGRSYRPLSLAIQQQLGVLTTRLEQNLRGARVVKAFAQERAEIAHFDRENGLWFVLSARAARLQAINTPLIDLIASLGVVLILWAGGTQVIGGHLSLGELIAFTTYMGQLVNPIRRMGMIIPVLAIAASAGQRVFDILDAESEVQDTPGAVPLPAVRGHVRFEGVSFAYFGRHGILRDLTFEALPGQVIALLGMTGSGKSTVTSLIPRFYDATSGRITIDGHDIRGVTLSSLRDQIGIVLQETTLFATTIRENIAFGTPDATEEEIVAAAEAAQAHDFIMETPGGYDTLVGERGVTLSGGQKQRVAIARALLKDPRILILDEATSALDTESERWVQAALERLMQGRTSFVIAHRLTTVQRADHIVVLQGGQIEEEGRHADLLAQGGLYERLWSLQFGGVTEDETLLTPLLA